MKHYEFWFVVGSQTLYGDDVLTHRRQPRGGNGAEALRRAAVSAQV